MHELEVIQWIVIGVLAVLVIGLYRQLATYLGAPPAGSLDALAGPRLRRKVPQQLLQQLKGLPAVHNKPYLLLFVSEGCRGCHRLLSSLGAFDRHGLDLCGTNIVLVPETRSELFLAALEDLDINILESDLSWSDRLNIGVTPFAVVVNESGIVTGKGVYDDIRPLSIELLGLRERVG